MSFDPGPALQKALITRLRNDPALTDLLDQRIYDDPPESPRFPYVSIGEGQCDPDRSDGLNGSITEIVFDIWSAGAGFVKAREICAAMRDSLDHAEDALVIAGHHCILCETLGSSFERVDDDQKDGVIAHGTVRVRVQTISH